MPAAKQKRQPKPEEPTPIMGYVPRQRSRWVEMPAELIDVEEGAQPLRVKIRSHLTFGQIDQIPYGNGVLYAEIEEAIVDYVLAWNVMARNAETGEMEPVAPPAEAGTDAFKFLSGFEIEWLAIELRKSSLGSLDELNKAEKIGALTAEQAERKKG